MIIGKEYDASLWCMLLSDKKNREDIIDFLRELPDEVLDFARKLAKGETDDCYYDVSPEDPTIKYYVAMGETDDADIKITKYKLVPKFKENGEPYEDEEQLFDLWVFPLDEDKMDEIDYPIVEDDSRGWIGSIYTKKGTGYDYSITSKNDEYYAKCSRLYLKERIEIPHTVKIDLNALPEDIKVGELAFNLRLHQ